MKSPLWIGSFTRVGADRRGLHIHDAPGVDALETNGVDPGRIEHVGLTCVDLQTDVDAYLEKLGGKDVHKFWEDDGKPDIRAAREFAERLREQYDNLPNPPAVEQSVNRVTVTAVL